MSQPYHASGNVAKHGTAVEEPYSQNPKREERQHALQHVNDWFLDMAAEDCSLREQLDGCQAKYEELKKHRIEVVQYLAAMRGWAMETTKTLRRLEKRTLVAEKEAAASKAEVLRLQELLSKNMAHPKNESTCTQNACKKRRRRGRTKECDDSHASSVQQ